jgi:hypothetical protein
VIDRSVAWACTSALVTGISVAAPAGAGVAIGADDASAKTGAVSDATTTTHNSNDDTTDGAARAADVDALLEGPSSLSPCQTGGGVK